MLLSLFRNQLSYCWLAVRCRVSVTIVMEIKSVLIFRLLRDQYDEEKGVGVKLRDKVRCDKVLNIRSGHGQVPNHSVYHLTSVIHHTGADSSSGHCTATLINANKKGTMWRYDDSKVTRVTKLDERTAYLLFYRKAS